MSSIIKVDTIQNQSGANIISESSNTITVGASGDTITVPSGATLSNSGTATGFGGVTRIDQWRITANTSLTGNTGQDLTANWERADDTGPALLGTGLSESSGVFTFPQTGFWELNCQMTYNNTTGDTRYIFTTLLLSTDGTNFSYSPLVFTTSVARAQSDSTISIASGFAIIDVTNISNYKFKFNANPSSNLLLNGDTDRLRSGFTAKRIGDT